MTDRKNERKVKIALEALRFPANLAHIYQDPEKKAAVLAAADAAHAGGRCSNSACAGIDMGVCGDRTMM